MMRVSDPNSTTLRIRALLGPARPVVGPVNDTTLYGRLAACTGAADRGTEASGHGQCPCVCCYALGYCRQPLCRKRSRRRPRPEHPATVAACRRLSKRGHGRECVAPGAEPTVVGRAPVCMPVAKPPRGSRQREKTAYLGARRTRPRFDLPRARGRVLRDVPVRCTGFSRLPRGQRPPERRDTEHWADLLAACLTRPKRGVSVTRGTRASEGRRDAEA